MSSIFDFKPDGYRSYSAWSNIFVSRYKDGCCGYFVYESRLAGLIFRIIFFPSIITKILDRKYQWWAGNKIPFRDSDGIGYVGSGGITYQIMPDGSHKLLTKRVWLAKIRHFMLAPYFWSLKKIG